MATTSGTRRTAARKPTTRKPAAPKSARASKAKPATTARKPAPKPAAAAAKPAPKPAPKPTVVATASPVVAAPDLKKRELVDLVVERSGIKKKDAKPVVEAMLSVLGETVAAGRELNLQPFGKLRINRATEKATGRVVVCKLRQSAQAVTPPPADPIVKAAE